MFGELNACYYQLDYRIPRTNSEVAKTCICRYQKAAIVLLYYHIIQKLWFENPCHQSYFNIKNAIKLNLYFLSNTISASHRVVHFNILQKFFDFCLKWHIICLHFLLPFFVFQKCSWSKWIWKFDVDWPNSQHESNKKLT